MLPLLSTPTVFAVEILPQIRASAIDHSVAGERWCDRVAPQLLRAVESWQATYWTLEGEFSQWDSSRAVIVHTTLPFWASLSSAGNGFRIGNGGSEFDAHGMLLLEAPQAGFKRFSCDQGGLIRARQQFSERDQSLVNRMIPMMSWFQFLDVDLLALPPSCLTTIDIVPDEVATNEFVPWKREEGNTLFLAFSSPSARTARYYAEVVLSGSNVGSWIAYRHTGTHYGDPTISSIVWNSQPDDSIAWKREVPMQGGVLHSSWILNPHQVNLNASELITEWAGGPDVPFLEGELAEVGVEEPRPGVITDGVAVLYSGVHYGPLSENDGNAFGIALLCLGVALLGYAAWIKFRRANLTQRIT